MVYFTKYNSSSFTHVTAKNDRMSLFLRLNSISLCVYIIFSLFINSIDGHIGSFHVLDKCYTVKWVTDIFEDTDFLVSLIIRSRLLMHEDSCVLIS